MPHVTSMNLTPDLRTAQADLGACDFGDIGESDLLALLEKFRALDPAQNHEAEPYLVVTTPDGRFHLRTTGQKLFLYDLRQSEKGGIEVSVAAIARELSAHHPRPENPAPETPVVRPRKPRNGIAAAILFAGVLLNGYTLYSFYYIDDVNRKPPLTLVTEQRELAGLRLSAAGRYATGKAPGDRIIEIGSDDRVRFLRVTTQGERPDSADTFRLGRHDGLVCLVTADGGLVDIRNIDTLTYYGDTYRRVRP